ncbi:MAG: DUF362 domain-containing protein [Nanoarchaeota archaeon]
MQKKSNKKRDVVSLVKCNSYKQNEVDKAISKSLKLLNFEIPKNKKILLKPNIVTANVKNPKATFTQPQILESVCKILKKNKCKIYIGESSFMDTDEFFKKTGIDKVAKKYSAKLIVFEQDKLVNIKNSKNKFLKEFPISKTLNEIDYIINLPKLKTHSLMRITGGIKNFYGMIPGGLKQKYHTKAKNHRDFSKLLVDIYQNFEQKTILNIMDGIIGMEGKGPVSGNPRKSNLVLCSKNALHLDITASKVIGYSSKTILTNKEGLKRKLGNKKFQIKGLKKIPHLKFKKPYVSDKLSKKFKERFKPKPIIVDKDKCVKCGICASKCPKGAITLNPYPEVDKRKCIRCFCCMEICPQHALSLKGEK